MDTTDHIPPPADPLPLDDGGTQEWMNEINAGFDVLAVPEGMLTPLGKQCLDERLVRTFGNGSQPHTTVSATVESVIVRHFDRYGAEVRVTVIGPEQLRSMDVTADEFVKAYELPAEEVAS